MLRSNLLLIAGLLVGFAVPVFSEEENSSAGAQAQPQQSESATVPGQPPVEPGMGTPPPQKPKWEIGAGSVTVDGEQWTRIALGVDVPIWKFGVFFDLELFVNSEGKFSNKGWNFKDDWVEALTRKIRYVRFGHDGDPLYIKFGGLDNVTLGYGFVVNDFTNMLHYPDEKLLGLQFYLNDLGPIGVTLQSFVADFKDFRNDGGLFGARLGFTPLKSTKIPFLRKVKVAGGYVRDINQYAPARKWDYTMTGSRWDLDEDGITDSTYTYQRYGQSPLYPQIREIDIAAQDFDTIIEHRDIWAKSEKDHVGFIFGDVGLPILSNKLISLDLYGQAAMRDDSIHGWGIGVPGVAARLLNNRIWANVEYRRSQGRFMPGYFNFYYLDERIVRKPEIRVKEQLLTETTLNGIYGRLGGNIANVLILDGMYQYMVGKEKITNDKVKDQRIEATASIGDLIIQKIPRLDRAELYFVKNHVGSVDVVDTATQKLRKDKFFERTEFMYWGYRAGFEITKGASLIWDSRFGWKTDENGKLVKNNFVTVQTAFTF